MISAPSQPPADPQPYCVLVDDNHRFGRDDERWQAGAYDTCDEALAQGKADR